MTSDQSLPDLSTRLTVSASELAERLGVSLRFVRAHQAEIPSAWIGLVPFLLEGE